MITKLIVSLVRQGVDDMPLKRGAKPGSKGFGQNIVEMEAAGHPRNQSIAAAYAEAGEKKKKKKIKKK